MDLQDGGVDEITVKRAAALGLASAALALAATGSPPP
jgi:hypothetical protein